MASASAGFLLAFVVSVILGGPVIGLLRRLGARQTVSTDAPAAHAAKQGTPTMGGLLILAGLSVPVALQLPVLARPAAAIALLGLTLAFGLIGFADDLLIATRGKNLGLKARQKLLLQVVFAMAFMLWLRANPVGGRTTVVRLWTDVDFGTAYYVAGALLIVGLSNAVNFADGLDGLASGVAALIALALAATVYAVGELAWLPVFVAAVAGGCAGFLWFNCHPAQVFMGDTGSLALGAALAGAAILGKAEAPLQLYSVIPWAALFSVIIQVSVFKYRRRRYGKEYAEAHRVFRRTPIHHHFEEIGWKETRIVQRFWLVTGVAVACGLAIIGSR